MLISYTDILKVLISNNITLTGVFHIGAHNCEELSLYDNLGIKKEDIVWIDAIESKVNESLAKGIPNVYQAIITNQDDEIVNFNISNNGQSSSILELGTHLQEHPDVFYVEKISGKTTTIDTFFERKNLDASHYNFWNFDIQGAELLALKGGIKSMEHVKAIYLEVNVRELYKGCALIDEVDAFLSQHNFQRVITDILSHGWGDALYIRTT